MNKEPNKLAEYIFRLSQVGALDSDAVLAACLRRMPEELLVRVVIDNDMLDPEYDEGDREILEEACKRLNIN